MKIVCLQKQLDKKNVANSATKYLNTLTSSTDSSESCFVS